MKQFKRTPLRALLDSLYTIFLPILPAILTYGIQKIAFETIHLWIVIVIYAVCLILTFLLTFYRNSSHFEVDEREVRHYHFGKLVKTYPLEDFTFFCESKITSAGTASLKVCIQAHKKTKHASINALGLGDKQVHEMIQTIHNFQTHLNVETGVEESVVEKPSKNKIDDIIQVAHSGEESTNKEVANSDDE